MQYPPKGDTIISTEAQPNTDHSDIESGRKEGQTYAGKTGRYSACKLHQ